MNTFATTIARMAVFHTLLLQKHSEVPNSRFHRLQHASLFREGLGIAVAPEPNYVEDISWQNAKHLRVFAGNLTTLNHTHAVEDLNVVCGLLSDDEHKDHKDSNFSQART